VPRVRWLGLDVLEIVTAIEAHFDLHRRLYVSGSGDGKFRMVEVEIRMVLESNIPASEPTKSSSDRGTDALVEFGKCTLPPAAAPMRSRGRRRSPGPPRSQSTVELPPPGLPGYENRATAKALINAIVIVNFHAAWL
jgi:hypothetical protein